MFPEIDFDFAEDNILNETNFLYNETSYLFDFDEGDFVYEGGNPVLVRGKDAIKIWIEKALRTRIYTYDIYDNTDEDGFLRFREYGSNIWQIIKGRKLPKLVLQAEIQRDIEETLSKNDKIKRVEDVDIKMGNDGSLEDKSPSWRLKISFRVILVDDSEFDMGVRLG